MDALLPLGFIGWFFTLASVAALIAGALLVMAMHRAGDFQRGFLARTAWNDMALFAIWILGLAGGIGVLMHRGWGRDLLEFFCWTLIALVLMSAATRLHAYTRVPPEERMSWAGAISGLLVVLIPLIAICATTIVTLRSDAVRAAFAG